MRTSRALVAGMVLAVLAAALAPAAVLAQEASGFVRVEGGRFVLNGQPFAFTGTNAYYMYEYENFYTSRVGPIFDDFRSNNVKVVRVWGYNDGPSSGGALSLQPSAGVYPEDAWRKFDSMVAKAKQRGIRLIIPFINHWHDYGGISQYCAWTGYTGSPAGSGATAAECNYFYTNASTKALYKQYIAHFLNRVNTVTGIAYKNEPAIFAWEFINEGLNRSTPNSGTMIRDWYREMAQYTKSIDTNHMAATGEEGYDVGKIGASSPYVLCQTLSNRYVLDSGEGTSFVLNCQIPEIDFAGAHLYPGPFGFSRTNNSAGWKIDCEKYIRDHARIAATYGKPFVLGEYGCEGNPEGSTPDAPYKQDFYSHLYSVMQAEPNVYGDMMWQFIVDGSKNGENTGNIADNRDPILTANLKQHGANMAAKVGVVQPPVDGISPVCSITSPAAGSSLLGTVAVLVNASDNIGVTRVDLLVDGALKGSDTAAPWQVDLNTATLASGAHSLVARAFDAAGNSGTSASVAVSVTNPPPPLPPTCTLTSPSAGATVSGSVNVAASASSGAGIARVDFRVDGALKSSDTTSPYGFSLDTTTLSNGSHTIAAQSVDPAGNFSLASSVSVTVSNAPVGGSSTDLWIFRDGLASGFSNASWNTTVNFTNGSPVYAGTSSISAATTSNWGGLSLRRSTTITNPSSYTSVEFYAHGGATSETLYVLLENAGSSSGLTQVNAGATTVNSWKKFSIPMGSLNSSNLAFDRIHIQSNIVDTFYVDEYRLVSGTSTTDVTAPSLNVNATASVTISGSAADNVGVAGVSYSNAANGATGIASGTTSWSVTVPVVGGSNVITITVRDAADNTSAKTVTVNVTLP